MADWDLKEITSEIDYYNNEQYEYIYGQLDVFMDKELHLLISYI